MIALVLLFATRAAATQETPLIVDADSIVYDEATQKVEATGNVRLQYRGIRLRADYALFDLREERLTARGRIVLIDTQGRELRGEMLTYDARLEQAEVFPGESIIDGVYVRSTRIATFRDRVLADETTFTTCDPARPAYRITARQIEIIPRDRLVARQAAIWLGSYRILPLPTLVISLRNPEETARSLPRVGYNNVDGFWIDYIYGYRLGTLPSDLYTKYGTKTGFIVRNTLSTSLGSLRGSLVVGRNQDQDLRIFDQAELTLATPEWRLGYSPLFFGVSTAGGWFREATTALESTRTLYQVNLRTASIPLGSTVTASANASWQDAFYGTEARQGVLRIDAGITHRIDSRSSVTLAYGLVEVTGATPFAFDAIAVTDRIDKASLLYARSDPWPAGRVTSFSIGPIYNFRDQTTSMALGVGQRASRYHWSLGTEYNLQTAAVKLTTDSGLALGPSTYVTVQAIYHTETQTFEDLDLILTTQLCDCISLSVKYRHVRQEFWLEVGVSPATRLQFPGP